MTFRELPPRLRVYILANMAAILPLVALLLPRPAPVDWRLLGVLLLCAMVFSTWKLELTVLQGKMTLSMASVIVALLVQGPQAAALCAIAGALTGSFVRPRQGNWRIQLLRPPLHRPLFNVANCFLACASASLLFEATQAVSLPPVVQTVAGLIVFTGVYYLVNTVGVSIAISLQQGMPWLPVWRENFLWTAPGYFASASAGAGIQVALSHLGPWALLLLAPIYVVYYSYRLYMDRLHLYSEKLERDVCHIQELNRLNRAVIASLATAIDAKDDCTSSHINRVYHYATVLAQAAGLEGAEFEAVATGALVHDIGKLGIPDHILSKPGKLSPDEFARIQRHVTIGTEILAPIPFPFPVVDVVRSHHERWDGLGYPDGLKGEDIPIGGRIISIVDVFDALTSDRPYRRALSREEALAILKESAGKQFDPRLVELFEKVLPEAAAEIQQVVSDRETQTAAGDAGARSGTGALNQIRQAAAEMAAVCDVAHSLAEQDTLEQVQAVVASRALALVPADTAVLYLRDDAGLGLVAVATEGKYHERLHGMTIQMGEGVVGWVAGGQQSQINVSAALDVARRFTPEETVELSSATAVPLVYGQEVLGVLAVYTEGYSVLTEHHVQVLNVLAEHAVVAIHNSLRLERQREMAYTDPLTGLANSRHLVRQLEEWTRSGSPGGPLFSVMMLDLDHFKEVNDTLGHLRGDELLRQIAETLTGVARDHDLVCRYAGDEFVLLLSGADDEAASRIAERVRAAIDALPAVEGRVKVSTSVGLATFPAEGREGRTLLHVADERMYADKYRRREQGASRGTSRLAADPGVDRSTPPAPAIA